MIIGLIGVLSEDLQLFFELICIISEHSVLLKALGFLHRLNGALEVIKVAQCIPSIYWRLNGLPMLLLLRMMMMPLMLLGFVQFLQTFLPWHLPPPHQVSP